MSGHEKVAAITGGSSGIGRAVAVKLGSAGATVAVAGRNEEEGQITAEQVEAAGGKAIFARVDVAQGGEVVGWIGDVVDRYGRLDWLVNNAGMNGRSARLEDTTHEEFERWSRRT